MQSRSRGMYPTRRIAKITIMNQIIWSERNMESAFGQNGTKPWIRRQVNFTSELAKCKYYANMIQGHPLISTNDYAFLFYLLPALGNKHTFLYWEALSTILAHVLLWRWIHSPPDGIVLGQWVSRWRTRWYPRRDPRSQCTRYWRFCPWELSGTWR